MKSVGEKILIELDEYRGVSSGKIFLTDSAETTPVTGKIVSLGSRVNDDNLKIGDRVHCQRYAGDIIERPNKKKYLSIKSDQIECIADGDWYYDFHDFVL